MAFFFKVLLNSINHSQVCLTISIKVVEFINIINVFRKIKFKKHTTRKLITELSL